MAVPIDVATGPGGPEPSVPLSAAGKAIVALRRVNLDAADDRLKLIAGSFMVPGVRAAALG